MFSSSFFNADLWRQWGMAPVFRDIHLQREPFGLWDQGSKFNRHIFPDDSVVKNPLAVWEMRDTIVQFLSQEDPLEVEMATHSSILAWRSHEQRSLVGYSPWGHKRVRHNWARMWACTHTHTCMQGQAEGIEIVCKGMLRNEAEWSWESSGWTREYPGRDENNVVILPKGKFSDHTLFQAQRNSRKCGELESVGLGSCFSLNTTGYAMLDKWFPGRWRGWTMKLKAHFSSQKTGSLLSVAGAQHYITS